MGSLTFALIVVFLSSWGCIETSKGSSLKIVKLSVEISGLPFLTELLGLENSQIDHIDSHTMAIEPEIEELLKQNNVQYKTINHEHESDNDADENGNKENFEQLLSKLLNGKKRRKRHATPEPETEEEIKQFCYNYIEKRTTFGPEFYKDEEMVYTTTYGYLNIMKWLKTMEAKHSSLVKIHKYGDTIMGKCLVYAQINKKKGQKVVVVDSAIHAREWGSVSSVLILIHKLVHEIERGNSPFSNYTFIIIPVFNPDGYTYSRAKPENRLWRKNRLSNSDPNCPGVDVNRNFCVAWDACVEAPTANTPKNPECSAIYKGKTCNDQEETKAFIKLVRSVEEKIEVHFNIHTSYNAWFAPYFYNSTSDPPNAVKERAVAQKAVEKIKEEYGIDFVAGRPYDILKYYSCGSALDWMVTELKVPYGYALELTPFINDRDYVFRINDTDVKTYGNVLTTGVKTVIEEINKN